ncbi:MAG TPA: hypothetical protein VFQ52_00810, partial [Rhizomicrobium sp.]|nr:hypothetical protein [Rhizomicrobium sp.]
ALMSLRLFRLPVLAAALAAAGCSQKIVVCPIPAVLADTASVTVMRPGTTPDLANELYTVTMTSTEVDCVYNNTTQIVRASMDIGFRATRAPTSEAATYSVPYFVVTHEGAKIYSKRPYTLRFTFAPGAATATIKQSQDDTRIRIENGKLPWNYQLLAGFQLTPAQIDYNSKKSRYLP